MPVSGALVERLFSALALRSWHFVTAESLTAGLVSSSCAGVSGASRYLWGAFVCYTNEAKERLLGVPRTILQTKGAVSRETAIAMAEGARAVSSAELAIALTGLAEGDAPVVEGSPQFVPAGTVWIAIAVKGKATQAVTFRFSGTRNEVRLMAAHASLEAAVEGLA